MVLSRVFLPGAVLLWLSYAAVPAAADVIALNFDNLPVDYMFLGGGQNIGSFYPGVSFGADVTGLDLSGSQAYPPHSGNIVIWSATQDTIRISFDTPKTTVGFWYTSFDPLTFSVFDDTGELLDVTGGFANTDGTTGASDFLSLSTPGISSATLSGSAGQYVLDDLTTGEAPEPATIFLSGSACLALALVEFLKRRQRT